MLGPSELYAALGRCAGALLVLGGGRAVWDDYARVRPWRGEIMAINDVGAHVHDTLRHWVTLHPEYLPGWRKYRSGHCYGGNTLPACHAPRVAEGVDVCWPIVNLGGTSGLFACFVGLMLGYAEIVLAGVPMDRGGHYFDPPWYGTDFGDDPAVTQVWRQAATDWLGGRVTSLSGRTREWLGAPR